MDRRKFHALLGAAGFTAGATPGGDPEVLRLSRNGWVPNNERLPVLLYRSSISASGADPATVLEQLFRQNQWPPQWRNGIYDFHHYHSTAHEVLGVARGHGRVMLGGENGREVSLRMGDVAVLPAGTGHCRIEVSPDFLVVGAYPPDQHWDICRSAPDVEAVRRMKTLPFSKSDPVRGASGPLTRLWPHAEKL